MYTYRVREYMYSNTEYLLQILLVKLLVNFLVALPQNCHRLVKTFMWKTWTF